MVIYFSEFDTSAGPDDIGSGHCYEVYSRDERGNIKLVAGKCTDDDATKIAVALNLYEGESA